MRFKERMPYYVLPLLMLLSFAFCAFSQTQFSFSNINTSHGLSNGNVLCVYKDSRELMWFGTEDGLNKYNGSSVEVFRNDPNDPNSISNNVVFSVFEDHELNLWVHTRTGLNLYDRKNNNFIPLIVKDSSIGCESCIIYASDMHDGKVWSWNNGSIFRYNIETGKIDVRTDDYQNSEMIKNKEIFNLTVDSYNRLWLADRSDFYYIDLVEKVYHKLEIEGFEGEIKSRIAHQEANGEIWLETYNGIIVLNGKDLELKTQINTENSNITGNQITDIEFDGDNNIWLATNTGLNLLSNDNYRKQNYDFKTFLSETNNPSSIRSNIIESIYADDEDRIWIGSRFGGVDCYDKNRTQFNYIGMNTGENMSLSGHIVTDMEQGPKGELFIASDGGGIDIWNLPENSITSMTEYAPFVNLGNRKVLALCFDASERLWVGYWDGGIDILDFQKKKQIHLDIGEGALGLSSNSIFTLEKDSRDNIWIGTFAGGLNRWNHQTNSITRFPFDGQDGLSTSGGMVLCVYEDSDGKIWIGQDPGGLNCFDYTTNTIRYFSSDTKSANYKYSDMVLSVYEDSKKRLWFGYRGKGLLRFDKKREQFSLYNVNDGLPNNNVYAILEDSGGSLWVSTNKGLSKVLIDDTDETQLTFINYDVNDGLQSNQFNLWSEIKLDNGTIIFGGVNGLNYFDPDQITNDKKTYNVIFTEFSIFNRPVSHKQNPEVLQSHISECKEVCLAHTQDVFSIEFTATNYTEPENNSYLCKLEGFDTEWRELNDENKVTYTNLDPGEYTFQVLASNSNEYWGSNPALLRVVVEPAWWETIFFRLGTLLALFVIVVFAARWRINSLKLRNRRLNRLVVERTKEVTEQNKKLGALNKELRESNKTKDKLFSIIAHDLRSPFNNILGFTEYLHENYLELNEDERYGMIDKVAKSTNKAFNLLSNLLFWASSQLKSISIKKERINVLSFVKDVLVLHEDNIQEKEIILKTNDLEFEIDFDPNHLQIVLNNLIANAIKFTFRKGTIEISGSKDSRNKIISIKDSGTGMSPEIAGKILNNKEFLTNPGTESEKGTGLGLMLVKELVDKNQASITVESALNRGTTFTISFTE